MAYNLNDHTSDRPFVFVYKCELASLRMIEYNATYYCDEDVTFDFLKKLLDKDWKIVWSVDGAFDFLDNDGLEFLLQHFDELVAPNARWKVIDSLFITEDLLSDELKTYLTIKTGAKPLYDIKRPRFYHYRPFIAD